jgi:L-rhamnose mutarotase
MKQIALTVNLRDDPDIVAAYRKYHAAVWPEVVLGLKSVGIIDMRIFALGRNLFMVASVTDEFDPDLDFKRYLSYDPRCAEWESLMSTMQEPVPEAPSGATWAEMELIFSM